MLKCLYNKEELGVEHMKKKSVINLIKYHAESNDAGFRSEAYEIAKDLIKQETISLQNILWH